MSLSPDLERLTVVAEEGESGMDEDTEENPLEGLHMFVFDTVVLNRR